MQLPIQSLSTTFAEPWEADATADDLLAIVRAADDFGFFYVGVCDHVAVPAEQAEAMGTQWLDTLAALAWIGGQTRRVRLLSHVYVPAYRHPLQVAKAWASLDWLTGGRAVLGAGAGHVAGEFDLLGVDFDARGRLLDEAIDAVRAAFAHEYPQHHGEAWTFAGLGQRPRPVQPGGPPIWVAGSSKPALRRAARRGDGWLPQGPVTPEAVAYLHEHREAAGRADEPFDIGAIAGNVYVGDLAFATDGGPCLSGPPEKLAHVLRKYAALGVGQVQVRPRGRSATEVVDQIAAFGSDVLPLLND